MQIYPAIHYTMGGTWVDYNLMTTIPGLYAIGEANFSDHGANRLGASALMQGLADGYFVLPYTIGDYLAGEIMVPKIDTNLPEFIEAEKQAVGKLEKLFNINGKTPVDHFHKRLGTIMWDNVGMARNAAGLTKAIKEIQELRVEFYKDLLVPGEMKNVNPELEKAGRVADFIELGELLARDALNRNESCGGHFREESATDEGEAKRDDENFAYVAAWEFKGVDSEPILHKEDLVFETIALTQRSYK
jgi:succinate dehydrogenase / fumarate reductase flavoprotein subunit